MPKAPIDGREADSQIDAETAKISDSTANYGSAENADDGATPGGDGATPGGAANGDALDFIAPDSDRPLT